MIYMCQTCDGYYAICKRCEEPGTRCSCGRYKAAPCPACMAEQLSGAVLLPRPKPIAAAPVITATLPPPDAVLVRRRATPGPAQPILRSTIALRPAPPTYTLRSVVFAVLTVLAIFGFLLKGDTFKRAAVRHDSTVLAAVSPSPKPVTHKRRNTVNRLSMPCGYCISNARKAE